MTVFDIKQTFKNSPLPRHWWQDWLCHVLNQPMSFLITHDDYVLSDDEQLRFDDGISQMSSGVPLAYLVGEQEFFGRVFAVNRHTLIPRADTERLVESVLDWAEQQGVTQGRILDLGTGSGCIGITLAKQLPTWQIVASDYSDAALQVARQNGERLLADNCTFVLSNWYDDVVGRFDVIVSNPPYIASDDEHLEGLTAEPITALVADDDGLADIVSIVKGAKNYLNSGGLLAIEHGYEQRQAVQAIFAEHGLSNIATVQDYGGNDRLTMGVYRG